LRLQASPPAILDFNNMSVRTQGLTGLDGSQTYEYACRFLTRRPRPGWGIEFMDYDYEITTRGEAGQDGQSGVQLIAGRLYREGY
jgi:hypothetical protein